MAQAPLLDVDVETIEEIKTLHPVRVIAAVTRAINKTARSVRKEASIGIREDLALKSSTVKEYMRLEKARREASPRAIIEVDEKPIPLKKYSARQIRKGVSVRVTKSGGRKKILHAFIVNVLKGNVFLREEDADRLPIHKKWGPSIYKKFEALLPELDKDTGKTLNKRIREEIAWEVEKLRRR